MLLFTERKSQPLYWLQTEVSMGSKGMYVCVCVRKCVVLYFSSDRHIMGIMCDGGYINSVSGGLYGGV